MKTSSVKISSVHSPLVTAPRVGASSTIKTPRDIALAVARRFGPEIQCSVILRRNGTYLPTVSTGRRAAVCDAVEAESANGPCVMAMEHLRGVLVDDIAACDQWPAWSRTALQAGFKAAAAMPAIVSRDAVIAVNLYSDTPRAWTGEDIALATEFATQVAETMAARLRRSGTRTTRRDGPQGHRSLG